MTEDFEDKKKVIDYRAQIQREREERLESDRDRRELMRQEEKMNLRKLASEGSIEAIKLAHELAPEQSDLEFEDHIRRENVRLQSYLQERNIALKFTEVEERLKTDNQLKLLMGEIVRSIAVKSAERKNDVVRVKSAQVMERLKHNHAMVEKEVDHANAKDFKTHETDELIRLKQVFGELTAEERAKFFEVFDAERGEG